MRIVRTRIYERALRKLGAMAAEIDALEQAIAARPEAGDVIPGLPGVRKIRFAMAGRGKRGGGRAIYYVVWNDEAVFMLTAYARTAKNDLTEGDKAAIRALVEALGG